MSHPRQVVVAEFGAAHGIKGEVRLKSFMQTPLDVAAYGPLDAPDGRAFEIVAARPAAGTSPNMLVVRLKGVADRGAAEALTGLRLSVPFDRLPAPAEDEYYHADLIGLSAVTPAGEPVGTIVAVANFGAGDLIEIAPEEGPTVLIPFNHRSVPEIDIATRRAVVVQPAFNRDDGEDGGRQ